MQSPERRSLSLLPLALLALLLLSGTALAAPPPGTAAEARQWDVDGLEPLLPRHETVAEREFWRGREAELAALRVPSDPPPVAPIRNCAEWEPCTGVLIRYPLGLPYALLRDLDDDVTLHVVVSSSYQSQALSSLEANGVDMSKVELLVRANDSIWTRDYGPWFVFDGNGDLTIIDHTYNRPWRPNDNLIPVYFGQQQGIPVVSHDMYHTGGNYMTDGAHISSSTELVYDEAASANGMTPAAVDQLMHDYYGVEQYHVLEYIESGGIHHIDTWAKFLDEETVLMKQVWESHWTYQTLEQRAALIASLTASTGRNYRVHRVYCQNIGSNYPASYTNSLILNDHIYVPLFGDSPYDEDALAAYETAAPGYTVHGYVYGGWLTDDALHCRAKGVMDRGMLRVEHTPIREDQPAGPVGVTAHVRAHSGEPITAVELHYRHGDDDWQVHFMGPTGEPGEYHGSIDPTAVDATCDYYVRALDESGRVETMPRTAPAAWFRFEHAGAPVAAPETAPARDAVLHANYPNPFNPSTTFRFDLKYSGEVELVVVDARGRLVRTLVDGTCAAGTTEVVWNGTDDAGLPVASGTYLYRLRAAGLQYTRPATLGQ